MRDRFGQMLAPAVVVLALVVAVPHLHAQAKPPVPAAESQESARKAATEIYGGRFKQAKTVAEKTALATEMIEAATKVQDGSPAQYVLLKIAADIATGAADAPTFCRKVGEFPQEQAARAAYRLPTEAEWEYACRAGTTTRFSFGENAEALTMCGWWERNSQGRTQPAGRLRPNAWGLYDMHGNVWEWCLDWWADDYYGMSPLEDPSGPAAGSGRVNRGGCYCSTMALSCRASCRGRFDLGDRFDSLGFPVARMIAP